MEIRRAAAGDLVDVRRLYQESSRVYLNGGLEDLPSLLNLPTTAVGRRTPDGPLEAFVAFQPGERTSSLPATAAINMPLRAALVGRGFSPGKELPPLLWHALEQADTDQTAYEAYALTAESWLIPALEATGFRRMDAIRFFRRSRRETPSTVAGPAALRPLRQEDLAGLARLDGETFEPVWHMGEAELLQLCFTCRMHVAVMEGQMAGYTALSLHPGPEGGAGYANLVRLAVHPHWQRRGIGGQLLVDAIAYAHAHGVYEIHLNTQVSNQSSQHLYTRYGFRARGRSIPLYVHRVHRSVPGVE